MMATENLKEWGTTLEVIQESIRAVVEAFANDEIELEKPDKKTKAQYLRYAPSFIAGEQPDAPGPAPARAYNGIAISKFLGWKLDRDGQAPERVRVALEALEQDELASRDEPEIEEPQHFRNID